MCIRDSVYGEMLRLRAERDDDGRERMYRIYFTAQNEQGLQCTGKVRVRVPRGKR